MTQGNWRDPDPNAQLIKAVRDAARDAQMEVANYSEGNHTFLKWVLGLCGVLTSAAVIGGIAGYAKLSAMDERTLYMQKQMDERERNMERQIEELKQLVRNHP